jgi:hypothetical protein
MRLLSNREVKPHEHATHITYSYIFATEQHINMKNNMKKIFHCFADNHWFAEICDEISECTNVQPIFIGLFFVTLCFVVISFLKVISVFIQTVLIYLLLNILTLQIVENGLEVKG